VAFRPVIVAPGAVISALPGFDLGKFAQQLRPVAPLFTRVYSGVIMPSAYA